ncbi:lipopolysaccharide biosynthesis protein [Butyrivibrio sp. WCD3002]|uniref:lipopolysaccharide biosynthesis protein n=1 Tax=Butyrivibrio sp. WCD3002 TaxID=1280676 RepID=UPI00041207EE|nr:hypothetical protein [Butyrivibrio sp. WCD3002]
MTENRKRNAAINFLTATFGSVINSILTFVSRTVFIYSLGTLYNGVNGLYTNVLGMLALAELGVGQAISFNLYKPIAENDTKRICAIMNFYRVAYRIIAGVVFVLGMVLVPFLKYLIKGAEGVDHLELYYLVFLFNTVSSYLLVYKSTLVEADQKKYLINNINTVIKAATTIAQIIVLLIFKNFLAYLVIGMVVQFVGNIYINYFCDKRYPYLKGENNEHLSDSEKNSIFTKIRALMLHKVGDKAVNQTDNIIISSFINITSVGLVANYSMLMSFINSFIISFFYSASAAIGNIISTEENRSYEVSKRYDFLGHVLYGWSTLCLYFLLTPFITLWIGQDKTIDSVTCFLICINFYFVGIRVPLSIVKGAAGLFEQDKWVPLLQAFTNLLVSIVGAKYLGLIGVYIGTLVSSLFPLIIRPIIIYRHIFRRSSSMYFMEMLKRILQMSVCFIILSFLFMHISFSNLIIELGFRLICCTALMTVVVWVVYHNKDELEYLIHVFKETKSKVEEKLHFAK